MDRKWRIEGLKDRGIEGSRDRGSVRAGGPIDLWHAIKLRLVISSCFMISFNRSAIYDYYWADVNPSHDASHASNDDSGRKVIKSNHQSLNNNNNNNIIIIIIIINNNNDNLLFSIHRFHLVSNLAPHYHRCQFQSITPPKTSIIIWKYWNRLWKIWKSNSH